MPNWLFSEKLYNQAKSRGFDKVVIITNKKHAKAKIALIIADLDNKREEGFIFASI